MTTSSDSSTDTKYSKIKDRLVIAGFVIFGVAAWFGSIYGAVCLSEIFKKALGVK